MCLMWREIHLSRKAQTPRLSRISNVVRTGNWELRKHVSLSITILREWLHEYQELYRAYFKICPILIIDWVYFIPCWHRKKEVYTYLMNVFTKLNFKYKRKLLWINKCWNRVSLILFNNNFFTFYHCRVSNSIANSTAAI